MNRIFSILVLVVLSGNLVAQDKTFVKDGVAINGYDAVAYFKESKPVKGDATFRTKWNNATWLFSSNENLKLFIDNPEKYAPQFGGFCAFGVSRGYTVATDPDAWTVVNNKLYLNYNAQVKEDWLKDRDNLILKAEKNWTDLKSK